VFLLSKADRYHYVDPDRQRTVWTINPQPHSDAHFATMPPKLAERCILAGCPVGGVVLDPFLGSGTTAEVAEALGRQWFGIELSDKYEALIKRRTSQKSLLSLLPAEGATIPDSEDEGDPVP